MTMEEALKIIKRWLLNGTYGLTENRLGYIEEWFHKEDAEAFEKNPEIVVYKLW